MADDIVIRLQICGSEYGSGETCLEAADEIERLRADRDRWRKIAGKLISGAEHQMDDLRFTRIPLNNPKWIEAWQAYDEAVRGE